MRLKIPKIKRKLKSALAMCLCVSMLAPTIAKGVISNDAYQRPEVAQSWTDAANAMAISHRYNPSGLAVAWYGYPMYWNKQGLNYPLSQAMAFEERPGYTIDEDCKPFIGRYAYCVNGHVPNYLVYLCKNKCNI